MTTSEDSTTIPLKRCSKGDNCVHPDGCLLPATSEYFPRNKRTKDGLTAYCKACNYEQVKKWRCKNPEKHRAQGIRYIRKYPEKHSENSKRWHILNRDHKRELSRRHYENNRERLRAYRLAWVRANPEKVRGYRRKYFEINRERLRKEANHYNNENREKRRLAWRNYNASHLPEIRIREQIRRARKRALPSTLTKDEWESCLNYFNGVCCYCGSQATFWNVLEQDHFVPVATGGGYTVDNIVPACRPCNTSKNATPAAVWLENKFGKRKAKTILDRIRTYFNGINQKQ